MAINMDRNKVAMDRLDEFEARINKAETELNDIFKSYKIPADVTDYNEKLSYALAEVGDDQAARDELKKKFTDAEKAFTDRTNSLKEDFLEMVKIGEQNLEKIAKEIEAEEEKLVKDEAEKAAKEEKLKAMDAELKTLNDEKTAIGGADGKGGQVAAEMAEANKLKNEQKTITGEIQKIDAELLKLEQEIDRLNNEMKNAKTQDEIDKISADLAAAQGKESQLRTDKNNKNNEFQEKENLKREHEETVRNLGLEYSNKDSQIRNKEIEKNKVEMELKLLPSRRPELDKMKKDLAGQVDKFDKTVEKLQKLLSEKGIDVKVEEKDKTEKENKDKEENKDNKEKDKKEKTQGNYGNGGGYGPANNPASETKSNVPAVTPEQKKKQNFDYITGYSDNGVGLSSEDRLKRIQSELGGRDYETMVKALTELNNSPVKLTKEEKNKIKETLLTDKKNLAKNIKDLDPAKLDNLSRLVGIKMTSKELKNLYYYSFDQKDKDSEKYGEANYGILSGFGSMPAESKSKWEDVVKSYTKNKENMSEEEIADFEKYVMTPLKFGTLHEQGKQIYGSPISKVWSKAILQLKGGNKLIEDIRSAIAESELGDGEDVSSRTKAKNFTETLKDQTEKNPPDIDGEDKEEKSKDEEVR